VRPVLARVGPCYIPGWPGLARDDGLTHGTGWPFAMHAIAFRVPIDVRPSIAIGRPSVLLYVLAKQDRYRQNRRKHSFREVIRCSAGRHANSELHPSLLKCILPTVLHLFLYSGVQKAPEEMMQKVEEDI
jgi:hypothetical protein